MEIGNKYFSQYKIESDTLSITLLEKGKTKKGGVRMTKKDGYTHRHKWIFHSWLCGARVLICKKCARGDR